MQKFIVGNGFKDETFWKTCINSKKDLTVDQLLKLIVTDYAKYGGFAINVNYNAMFEASEWNHIPFEQVRLGRKDDLDNIGKYFIYDWSSNKKYDKKKVQLIDKYNPNPEIISYQMKSAGGIDKFKGQLFYFSSSINSYPLSPADAVIESIVTDSLIKNGMKRGVTNNFTASHVFEYPYEFETEEEREEIVEGLKTFMGSDNLGKCLVLENPNLNDDSGKNQALKITKIDQQNNLDKMYEFTSRFVKDSIIECFGIPPVLLGVAVAGKLGNADEVRDGFKFYNAHTSSDRKVFEETFLKLFGKTKLNPSNSFEIIRLEFDNEDNSLVKKIGVDGMRYLIEALENATLSNFTKKGLLTVCFGLTESEINQIIDFNAPNPIIIIKPA